MLFAGHTNAQLEIGAKDGSRNTEAVFHVKHLAPTPMKTLRKEEAADRANTSDIPIPDG
jgi:hypothetical protein